MSRSSSLSSFCRHISSLRMSLAGTQTRLSPLRSISFAQSIPLRPSFPYRQLHSSRSILARSRTMPRDPTTSLRRGFGTSFLGSGGAGSGVMTVYYAWLGLNTLPFAALHFANYTHNNRLLSWWYRNMLCSVNSSSRPWTYLTSAIAHEQPMHLAFNMITARTFCQILSFMPGMGAGHAVAAIVISSLSSSLGYRWLQVFRANRATARDDRVEAGRALAAPALGASGAVMGLGALATCFAPYTSLQIMFVPIAVPLWAVTAVYTCVDLYGAQSNRSKSRTANAGHLGGLAAGFAYYFLCF